MKTNNINHHMNLQNFWCLAALQKILPTPRHILQLGSPQSKTLFVSSECTDNLGLEKSQLGL